MYIPEAEIKDKIPENMTVREYLLSPPTVDMEKFRQQLARQTKRLNDYNNNLNSLNVNEIQENIEEVKDYEIFYGFGHDFYCNITDGDDRAIPSMGPIRILEYM